MNAVIFVRVSKVDQDYNRQLIDLREVAKSKKLTIVSEIYEKISGSTSNDHREGIAKLLDLSRNGEIQIVLVQEISRLGRSTIEVLKIIEELTNLRVNIYVQNFGIETLKDGKKNPVAQFLYTLMAEFARLEREILRERIVSGMQEAKRNGKKIGRPKGEIKNSDYYLKKYSWVVRNLKQGISIKEYSKDLSGIY